MIDEARRRACLGAMQVVSWLPRVALPFAAPSRPELLEPLEPQVPPAPVRPGVELKVVPEAPPRPRPVERAKIEIPRPAARIEAPAAASEEAVEPVAPKAVPLPPPRFALQLLRAGRCALLVELPTGEPFQSRDPAYLLLRDLLRAAGLPDSPRPLGEPVRWPLFRGGNLDQGPQAAREYVQTFVAARLEEEGDCACLWLVGLPALRFAAALEADAFNRERRIEGLPPVWVLPGLETLMEEPARKAELWRAMRQVRVRWISANE
ncbi:energy transducer TonB [Azotobacter chroococcum subsp. isscasi]|uniref:energy transducer TonB n=1 Tax=Azotobacter chroococcum TaxID=353 RepID=UPI00103E775B|nr:energy transducer TonB [Azotobacter chroococcum]TBW06458.1 energy transducer TonB [Azotobacter chroococcum subsp. isscasi]